MDPRVLASERPQEGRREQERGNVEGKQEPAVGGQVLQIGRVLLRRRQLQDKGREHVQRRVGGLEETIDPQQPGPPVPATGPQQQAGGCGMPDELGRHEDGHLAVLAKVVAPGPRQQQQCRRHLDGCDGDEHVDGAPHDRAAVGAGRLNGRRRRAARQHTLDDAQILDLRALGARGQPGAPLPLHLLVQRERVRHLAYQIVTVVGVITHPESHRAAPALADGVRPADSYLIYSLMTSGWPETDGFRKVGRRRGRAPGRAGELDAIFRRPAA